MQMLKISKRIKPNI